MNNLYVYLHTRYLYLYVSTFVSIYLRIYLNIYVFTYRYIDKCIYVFMHVDIYLSIYLCILSISLGAHTGSAMMINNIFLSIISMVTEEFRAKSILDFWWPFWQIKLHEYSFHGRNKRYSEMKKHRYKTISRSSRSRNLKYKSILSICKKGRMSHILWCCSFVGYCVPFRIHFLFTILRLWIGLCFKGKSTTPSADILILEIHRITCFFFFSFSSFLSWLSED